MGQKLYYDKEANYINRYKLAILAVILPSFMVSFFPLEAVFPILIICLGLSICIFLRLFCSKEDHNFLTGVFVFAFLFRVFIAFFISNLKYLSSGRVLFGDGWCYSENGYEIAKMWRSGISDTIEIISRMREITVSGTLGVYDFWNAFVYFFTGKSPFSLIFINCLASSLTLIFIYYITKQLCSRRAAMIAAILTAFWPSLFLWSIQNLKESISIFLLSVLLWAIVCFRKRFRLYLILSIVLVTIALKNFRSVSFVVCYAVVVPLSLLLPLWKSRKIKVTFFMLFFSLFVLLFADSIRSSLGYFTKFIPVLKRDISFLDWAYTLRSYRAMGASSAFLTKMDFTNPLVFCLFAPLALATAWLAPFPWQLGSRLQVMAMPEMLLYYFLIPFVIFGIKYVFDNRIKEGGIIVVYIFVMLFALAFLEGNIGTLFRHRALVLPFMFVLAGIGLDQKNFRVKIKL